MASISSVAKVKFQPEMYACHPISSRTDRLSATEINILKNCHGESRVASLHMVSKQGDIYLQGSMHDMRVLQREAGLVVPQLSWRKLETWDGRNSL